MPLEISIADNTVLSDQELKTITNELKQIVLRMKTKILKELSKLGDFTMTNDTNNLFATRVRVARPTDQLERVVAFYRDGIGLPVIGQFEKHEGYDGVILGMPDASYQLEFTQHEDGSPCPAPTHDNLLVFYIPEQAQIDTIVTRLAELGYHEVPPENPYWNRGGVTIADPDGWRVVLYLWSDA
jgi:catechol 2,3-dioxygenase-like lactoylglutathione lyase family enzyme